ncbi:MAG: hypothetical protein LBM93_06665, partial [Oscillospiraceae bacterium]|nr:hypothetical protein [Oscillospiraceae bacterium]
MAVSNLNTYQGDMLLSMLGWQGKTRAELNEEIAGVKVPDPEDILSPKKGLNGEKPLTEKQKAVNDLGEKLQRICHKMLWYDMLNNEIRVGYAELVKPERVIKFHESMPRLYEIEALDMYFGRRKAVKWMHEYDCVLKTSIMGNFTSKGIIHGVKHSIIEKEYELFMKLVNKGFEDFLLPLFK